MPQYKHTALPWYCLPEEHNKAGHMIRSKAAKCEVARASEQFMARGQRLANARFIALACNHHYELVEVLQQVEYESPHDMSSAVYNAVVDLLAKIKLDPNGPDC